MIYTGYMSLGQSTTGGTRCHICGGSMEMFICGDWDCFCSCGKQQLSKGWECPVCSKVHAPHVNGCDCHQTYSGS